MEKEFNLSEKGSKVTSLATGDYKFTNYRDKDVKEFIKRLKKELKYFEEQFGYLDYDAFKVRIDKLAGKELIKNE